jgi:hypothetical protein
MNNKKNIIIFLLVIIFILQFLIFLQLKTYKIDNFSNTTKTKDTTIVAVALYSVSLVNETQNSYITNQCQAYSFLLDQTTALTTPLTTTPPDIVTGLVIYLSCLKCNSNVTLGPILELMSINLPDFAAAISKLQKSFANSQIALNTFYSNLNTKITTYISLKGTPGRGLDIALNDITLACSAISGLNLTDSQTTSISDIINNWKKSKNNIFTTATFNTYKLYGNINLYISLQEI